MRRRAKLRLHVEFSRFIDVAHDMDRRARQNQKRLFDVDIDGLRLAVLILDENTSRKGERTVEPAVDNQSAVGFERQTLDAAVDFGGDCFDAEAGRILMRRTDAEAGLARVAADAERGALRAFFREIIGFSLFDLPCIALVELYGSRSVQHGGELIRRLKGGRGHCSKILTGPLRIAFWISYRIPFSWCALSADNFMKKCPVFLD